MAEFVGDEFVDELAGTVRHAEDAGIDHDQPAALVAVPAEIRLDDREIGIRVGTEPPFVDGEGLGHDATHLPGVKFVFGKRERMDTDVADLRRELLEAGARDNGKIAHARSLDVDCLPTAADVPLAHDGAAGGEFFAERQRDVGRVNPGLVEKRQVPRNERRRLPALIVVKGQDREPLYEERDSFPLPPTPLPLRQSHREGQLDGDLLVLMNLMRKIDLQSRRILGTVGEGERDATDQAPGRGTSNRQTLCTSSGGPLVSIASLGARRRSSSVFALRPI